MRPRLTQLSLAVIMESTNIILVYCPPSRGLIFRNHCYVFHVVLLPPIAGIDTAVRILRSMPSTIAPIAGIDSMPRAVSCSTAAPLPHSSIHLPHPHFAFPSPPSIQVRRLLRFENDYKNIFDLTVAPSRKNDIMCMNEKINAFCMRFGSEGRKT